MSEVIQPSERPVRARAAGPRDTPVVIGLDLGTTSAKAVAIDPQLRVWASTGNAYPLHSPHQGGAEQDPDDVADAAITGLRAVVATARDHGADVRTVCLSAAMHSILALDDDGTPLTRALTYADSRADAEAASLRGSPQGQAIYQRTRVPQHPIGCGENMPTIRSGGCRTVTFVAVADAAHVSRSWLYRDADIRTEIERRRTTASRRRPSQPSRERSSDTSLRQRLENLLDDNRVLRGENHRLREQLATLFGEQRAAATPHAPRARTLGPCS